jgi:Ca2+-binding RTX toxin-like protein
MATYNLYLPGGQYPGQYLPDHWAVDYNPSLGELLDYGTYETSGRTKAVYEMDNGVTLVITGSALTYAKSGQTGSGTLNGGTITAIKLLDTASGATMQSVSGLSWEGSNFFETVRAGSSWYTASVVLRGNDKVVGTTGDDDLYGFDGNDTLTGGAGYDYLVGGRGRDTYDGGTSGDDVDQLAFDDAYNDYVGAHGVTVNMSTGKAIDPWGNAETFKNIERIKGTQFADKMTGSAGDDQFRPLGGKDVIDGAGGSDRIMYDRDIQQGGNAGVTVNLAAGYGIDGFGHRDTLKNIENVTGSNFADTITGSSAGNNLKGGDGNDKLSGGSGADKLFGERGADDLYGGSGNDKFVFESLSHSTLAASGRDTIYDLTSGDKIDLSLLDANKGASGNQTFEFIGTKAFSGDAGELRFVKQASDTYIYADVNGDKKADFAIHLDDAISVSKGYFFL